MSKLNDYEKWLVSVLFLFGVFSLSFLLGITIERTYWKRRIIENGAGYIDPIKNELVWIKHEPIKVELKLTPNVEEKK